MTVSARLVLAFGLTSMLLPARAAAADAAPPKHCTLSEVGEFNFRTEPDGTISIPIEVEGQKEWMLLDTGAETSVLTGSAIAMLPHLRHPAGATMNLLGGIPSTGTVKVDQIAIGNAKGRDILFWRMPDNVLDADTDGLLGGDYLSNFDVEIDYAAGKVYLFLPNDCTTPPVHWLAQGYARLPFEFRDHHIVIDVTLDNKSIKAAVDTGASRSVMASKVALDLLGSDDEKVLKPDGQTTLNGIRTDRFAYRFSELDCAGLQVRNPDIEIDRNADMGSRTMLLGASVLRRLHLYIAYKARVIYLSAAEPDSAATAVTQTVPARK